MSIIQKFFICVWIFLAFTSGVFASEHKNNTKKDTKPTTEQQSQDLQWSINSYILEIYKFQGNKIVQELSDNLEKVTPTKIWKIEAYTSIQDTLNLKKKSIENDNDIKKNTKIILIKYLEYIVKEIEIKKTELQ